MHVRGVENLSWVVAFILEKERLWFQWLWLNLFLLLFCGFFFYLERGKPAKEFHNFKHNRFISLNSANKSQHLSALESLCALIGLAGRPFSSSFAFSAAVQKFLLHTVHWLVFTTLRVLLAATPHKIHSYSSLHSMHFTLRAVTSTKSSQEENNSPRFSAPVCLRFAGFLAWILCTVLCGNVASEHHSFFLPPPQTLLHNLRTSHEKKKTKTKLLVLYHKQCYSCWVCVWCCLLSLFVGLCFSLADVAEPVLDWIFSCL